MAEFETVLRARVARYAWLKNAGGIKGLTKQDGTKVCVSYPQFDQYTGARLPDQTEMFDVDELKALATNLQNEIDKIEGLIGDCDAAVMEQA